MSKKSGAQGGCQKRVGGCQKRVGGCQKRVWGCQKKAGDVKKKRGEVKKKHPPLYFAEHCWYDRPVSGSFPANSAISEVICIADFGMVIPQSKVIV